MYDELVAALRRQCVEMDCGNCNTCVKRQAADAIEELSKPSWIPVSERLPEKSTHYLVHIECKCDGELMSKWTQMAWFCEKFYWEHLHSDGVFKETVTHWMPLPELPKEE